MTAMNVLYIAILLLILFGIIIMAAYVLFRHILVPYKLITKEESFDDLLMIFKLIINTKLDEYDKNVFKRKQSLDNAAYENYYMAISVDIYESISPHLITKLKYYMNDDAIYQILVSTVNVFLSERI